MNLINSQIAAVRQQMRQHAISGALDSYNLVKTVSPRTPPPRRLSELTVQEIREIDKAYRVAYFELRKVSYGRLKSTLQSLLNVQKSMPKPTRGPSTAFITKGS